MDMYNVTEAIADCFSGLQTKEEIESRAAQMIKFIMQQKEMCKKYLEAGIL